MADSAWSFSFRSGAFDVESSDDSDTEPGSSDALLIKDLDISSREDNATYKANPWSIAKINAATRPSIIHKEAREPAATFKSFPGVKAPKGALEHAFKRQQERGAMKRSNQNQVSPIPH